MVVKEFKSGSCNRRRYHIKVNMNGKYSSVDIDFYGGVPLEFFRVQSAREIQRAWMIGIF